MSYWDHRKPVTRQRAVDTSAVARTAVRILDTDGLRALTVRAVAKELDVAAASLYSRISSADDILDLALDDVLGRDATLLAALDKASLRDVLMAFFRHLVQHPWACRVIAMRAPRGPNYLRLSERMCVLLMEQGSPDPLGDAYALSNFVIGSATTAPMADHERVSVVDEEVAPEYAALHAVHRVDPEEIVRSGLDALLRGRSS